MSDVQSKINNEAYTNSRDTQIESHLSKCPPEILVLILEHLVGKRGSLNVRISLPPPHITAVPPYYEPRNDVLGPVFLKPFMNNAEEPFWKRLSYEEHTGFSDLLNFMQTCQRCYEFGVEVLYTHPVFTFERLETAALFFTNLPLRHRNTVSTLKLALPYSEKVPCMCPKVDDFMAEHGFADGSWHVRIGGMPSDSWESSSDSLDVELDDPVDAEQGYGSPTSNIYPWTHGKEPRELDSLIHDLPGLKTLILEENPSILAPVLLGDSSEQSWLEKIGAEQGALKRSCSHIDNTFGSRVKVIVREHRGEDAVGKWTATGFDAESVERHLGGLPVLSDGMWIYW